MGTIVLDAPLSVGKPAKQAKEQRDSAAGKGWLIFQYAPAGLFSLKISRATSTAGKTFLVPTPYVVKMAFLDALLRSGLIEDAEETVRLLAAVDLRIGVPEHVCVTGTIQNVRQETREAERKLKPDLPPYRSNIALREFAHWQGTLRVAFDLFSCQKRLKDLLLKAAPVINYLGKRGSFVQYLGVVRRTELDSTYTIPGKQAFAGSTDAGQITQLDDFGAGASFAALNSFSSVGIKAGVHRVFVDTSVPLAIYNNGPGFVHYHGRRDIL